MYKTQQKPGNGHSPNLYLCPSYKAYFRLTSNSRVGILFLKRLLPAEVIQLHFSKGHFEITFPLELPTAILLELGIESYKIHSGCYPIREDQDFIRVDF